MHLAVQWPWPQVTPLHTSSPSQLPRLTCIGEPAYLTPTYPQEKRTFRLGVPRATAGGTVYSIKYAIHEPYMA